MVSVLTIKWEKEPAGAGFFLRDMHKRANHKMREEPAFAGSFKYINKDVNC